MTLHELERAIYRRVGLPDDPGPEHTTRIRGFLNERYDELLAMPGIQDVCQGQVRFTSAANQWGYGLDAYGTDRLLRVRDVDNQWRLEIQTADWWRDRAPDPSLVTGTPTHLILLGLGPVSYWDDPGPNTGGGGGPAPTSYWAVSSSASDTTPICYVDAIRLTGEMAHLSATLTGTTRVALTGGTSNTIRDIDRVTLSKPAVGTVTIWNDQAAGTAVSTIPPGETTARFHRFALYPTPSTVIEYIADVERTLQPLARVSDEPILPQRFHRLLIIGGRMDEYEKRDDTRYQIAVGQWEQGKRELLEYLHQHQTRSNRLLPSPRYSRLGPWFPAGT
jgi:hypothetical protein